MQQGHRRRIRNYLLDPKLQLRYTLMMVTLSSLLTAGLGYIWYRQMRETSMTVEVKALASMDVDAAEIQQLRKEMKAQDNLRLLALVGFGLLFALVLAGGGIILTHKIAGPLYKIGRHMGDLKNGDLKEIWNLRKGDQLQEFFGEFKEMHTALREREQDELDTLNQVIESAEAELTRIKSEGQLVDMDQQLAALRELRDQKEGRLNPKEG
jgi:nitrogen fixation/metabolism regulation signal transduction histidine kinase